MRKGVTTPTPDPSGEFLKKLKIYQDSTLHDNYIWVNLACQFDKIHKLAKKEDIDITIQSGFRNLRRQWLLFEEYRTGKRTAVAAKPGTSNHGDGIGLDISASCGQQKGKFAPEECRKVKAYMWMLNHGPENGFTRNVPSETWHWAFKGLKPTPDLPPYAQFDPSTEKKKKGFMGKVIDLFSKKSD